MHMTINHTQAMQISLQNIFRCIVSQLCTIQKMKKFVFGIHML